MHFHNAVARGLATFTMPDESTQHNRTLMAWPSLLSVSGNEVALNGSRQEVASIANAIAQFEPVTLYAPEADISDVFRYVGENVTPTALDVDNLWMRDTGPTYVVSSAGQLGGVDFNFNDWGMKLKPDRSVDWTTADRILKKDGTYEIKANITMEGGAIEIDGAGTLMATESAIINDNRNPGKSKEEIEQALTATLGVSKFIWIKGVKGEDITDDHIDGLARFVRPGVVLLSRPAEGTPETWVDSYNDAKQVLQDATDASGRQLTIHEIGEPANPNFSAVDEFGPPALNYVNYYLVNGGLIMPKFGDDQADAAAKSVLEGLFRGRRIVQVQLHWIPVTGGGIHCSTQQVPQTSCQTNGTSSCVTNPTGSGGVNGSTPTGMAEPSSTSNGFGAVKAHGALLYWVVAIVGSAIVF